MKIILEKFIKIFVLKFCPNCLKGIFDVCFR